MATQGTWLASCNQNALQPTHTPSTSTASTASTTFLLSIFNFMIAHSWWFDFFDAREIYTKWRVSVALQGQFDGSVVSYPFRTSDGWSISLASVHTEQVRVRSTQRGRERSVRLRSPRGWLKMHPVGPLRLINLCTSLWSTKLGNIWQNCGFWKRHNHMKNEGKPAPRCWWFVSAIIDTN